MKKSELKQLLRLALVSAEAGRIDALGARSDHAKTAQRYVEMKEEWEKCKQELPSARLRRDVAEAKLCELGCALDVDGVNWVDAIPKPEDASLTAALMDARKKLESLGFRFEGGQWLKTAVYASDAGAEVKPAWPAAPSPSSDWVRGTCVPPTLLPGTLIEYQNFAGQLFAEKAEDVISWNSVSWWRVLPVGKVITQKADEMLSCRGVAKPNDGVWQRGDSGEVLQDSARIEYLRMDGTRGRRAARGLNWSRVAWWRLAE